MYDFILMNVSLDESEKRMYVNDMVVCKILEYWNALARY